MKTYIADIIPSLQRYSKKLDDLTKLSNQHWVSIDDETNIKTVFISEKIMSLFERTGVRNGRNSWRYLDNQSIEIEFEKHFI
ncbi:MAG: hypothetical protein IPN88_17610 [Bacteroidetes bacterium]|nr:hypothetical protein [Bacteroidota bacterium]